MEQEIKVERAEAALSLSGNSEIGYEIGSLGDNRFIRLSSNSGGGLFCKNWVALEDIKKLISGVTNVTSKTIQPVYAGRSNNSAGFLRACLINENIIPAQSPPDKPAVKIRKKAGTAQ